MSKKINYNANVFNNSFLFIIIAIFYCQNVKNIKTKINSFLFILFAIFELYLQNIPTNANYDTLENYLEVVCDVEVDQLYFHELPNGEKVSDTALVFLKERVPGNEICLFFTQIYIGADSQLKWSNKKRTNGTDGKYTIERI